MHNRRYLWNEAQRAVFKLVLSFFLNLVLTINLLPQMPKTSPESADTIKLVARNQEKEGEVWLASGEVELSYGNLTLLADRLQFNSTSFEVLAEGQVTLQLPSEVVVCEKLAYNLKTGEGRIEGVRAITRPTLMFGAELIDKSSADLYHLEKAWFTTCTQPVPRWSFSFSQANLKLEDYVAMNQAVFKIKNFPVIYTPYLKYPLKDRATGFLFPKVGYNRVKGLTISQSFYWAIARNMDATFNADYYSRKGLGGGVEYRYALAGGTKGEINSYVFFFKKEKQSQIPDPAFLLRLNHQQNLPYGFKLTGQVDHSSSFNFLREFESNFSTATVNNRSYQLGLSKSWSYFNFNLRSSRFETYFPQTGQKVVTGYLPQVSFNLLKFRILPSTYLSFDSGLTNWQYSWHTDMSEDSYHLGNAYFRPNLNLSLLPAHWLNFSLKASGNFIWYFQSYAPGTSVRTSRDLLATQASLGFNLEGPIVYKIYFNQGQPFLKHLIEPFISYVFDTPLPGETKSRIISPLGLFRNNDLKYGLVQHFLIKQKSLPREILTVGLSQTLFLKPIESPVRYYYPLNPDRHFSPVNAYLRYYPSGKFNLDISADFNPYEQNFLSSRISANFGRSEDNLFLSLNWSKNYQIISPESFFRSHQLGLQAGWRWPEKLDLKTQAEFDLENKKILYTALAGTYHYQCLDFSFDLRVFYFRTRPEVQFRFSIGLGNISQSSDLLGALGF